MPCYEKIKQNDTCITLFRHTLEDTGWIFVEYFVFMLKIKWLYLYICIAECVRDHIRRDGGMKCPRIYQSSACGLLSNVFCMENSAFLWRFFCCVVSFDEQIVVLCFWWLYMLIFLWKLCRTWQLQITVKWIPMIVLHTTTILISTLFPPNLLAFNYAQLRTVCRRWAFRLNTHSHRDTPHHRSSGFAECAGCIQQPITGTWDGHFLYCTCALGPQNQSEPRCRPLGERQFGWENAVQIYFALYYNECVIRCKRS